MGRQQKRVTRRKPVSRINSDGVTETVYEDVTTFEWVTDDSSSNDFSSSSSDSYSSSD
jgi:hypothetical protein